MPKVVISNNSDAKDKTSDTKHGSNEANSQNKRIYQKDAEVVSKVFEKNNEELFFGIVFSSKKAISKFS